MVHNSPGPIRRRIARHLIEKRKISLEPFFPFLSVASSSFILPLLMVLYIGSIQRPTRHRSISNVFSKGNQNLFRPRYRCCWLVQCHIAALADLGSDPGKSLSLDHRDTGNSFDLCFPLSDFFPFLPLFSFFQFSLSMP